MNKELAAWEKIKNNYLLLNTFVGNEIEIIETALKNYVELTNKPVILYGRTHANTQALIDTICKNYKEVKIINLEDEKKLKALEIIKAKRVNLEYLKCCENYKQYKTICSYWNEITQEEFELLKGVLL